MEFNDGYANVYGRIICDPSKTSYCTTAKRLSTVVAKPRNIIPDAPVEARWPSGLRRQTKDLVFSEAWVRIPLSSLLFLPSFSLLLRVDLGDKICRPERVLFVRNFGF